MFGAQKFHRESNRAYLAVRERIGTTLASLQEGISGVRVVQAYGNFLKYGMEIKPAIEWGAQPLCIGSSRVFVTPNPSPANAAWSLDDLVDWYRRLAAWRDIMLGATDC